MHLHNDCYLCIVITQIIQINLAVNSVYIEMHSICIPSIPLSLRM